MGHLLHQPPRKPTPLPPTPPAVCAGAPNDIFRFFLRG